MIHKPTTPKIYTPQDKSCVLSLDARDVRGDKIYDRSGEGNHGTIIGAVLKPGNYGVLALEFDGVDDWVDCNVNVDTTVDFSLEVMMKQFAGYNNINAVFADSGYNVGFGMDNDGTISFFHFGGALSTTKFKASDDELVKIGWWVHYVGTFVASSGAMKLYKNGLLVGTDILTGTPRDNANNLRLSSSQALHDFIGQIAIAKRYNRELSSSEISQRSNNLRHQYGI